LSQSQQLDSHKSGKGRGIKPATVTVQLTSGTVVIRRLKCGLLFVCVGPANSDALEHGMPNLHDLHVSTGDASHVGSPDGADSVLSAGAQTTASLESTTGSAAAVAALRRHAAELARWLDDKLGTLTVPEEGVGVE
jgi:hypothetical protein